MSKKRARVASDKKFSTMREWKETFFPEAEKNVENLLDNEHFPLRKPERAPVSSTGRSGNVVQDLHYW